MNGYHFTSKVYELGILFTQKVYEWVKFEKYYMNGYNFRYGKYMNGYVFFYLRLVYEWGWGPRTRAACPYPKS